MREIKFRAKRLDPVDWSYRHDGWVYGHYFKAPLTDENSGTKPEDGWFFLCGEERHCIEQDSVVFTIDVNTLGQYTGLKDKNDKELYFKDYINIYVGDEYHKTCQIHNIYDLSDLIQLINDHGCNFSVYGNIYDSPNLLD